MAMITSSAVNSKLSLPTIAEAKRLAQLMFQGWKLKNQDKEIAGNALRDCPIKCGVNNHCLAYTIVLWY